MGGAEDSSSSSSFINDDDDDDDDDDEYIHLLLITGRAAQLRQNENKNHCRGVVLHADIYSIGCTTPTTPTTFLYVHVQRHLFITAHEEVELHVLDVASTRAE